MHYRDNLPGGQNWTPIDIEAGLPAICIETRHVKAALKAMTMKTDKNDARGMAQLMRMGWFRPVHKVKAPVVHKVKVALARKLALVMPRMWVNGTNFRWGEASVSAA